MPERVVFSPCAAAEVRRLKARHGELIFHQSGGCCEGSAPMCLRGADFRTGDQDVLLGSIEGCPFYIDGEQLERWGGAQLSFFIDVLPSSSDSFSLEVSDDLRFVASSPACAQ